jgi:hypothetical protein
MTYSPSGTECLSYADAAAVLSAVVGRLISFNPLTFEEEKRWSTSAYRRLLRKWTRVRSIDVWETKEDSDRFFAERLMPAMASFGIAGGPPLRFEELAVATDTSRASQFVGSDLGVWFR